MLKGAQHICDIERAIPDILQETLFYLKGLKYGRVNPHELVVRRRVQKEAAQYVHNSLNAMVVKELAHYGIHVQPGESVEYVIIDQTGKREPQKAKSMITYRPEDGYDIDKYSESLLKAVETLLSPFGYDLKKLKDYYRTIMTTTDL